LKNYLPLLLSSIVLGAVVGEGRAGWGDRPPGSACCPPPGPPVVVGSAPCDCAPRPGLFARMRERFRARTSCSDCCTAPCPPRPGLFQRIRNRISERRGTCVPACP
jgi:hypothetical protein